MSAFREASRSVTLRAEEVTGSPPHRGTEGLECLDEHRSVDFQTLDWLGRPKLLESWHFEFSKGKSQSAPKAFSRDHSVEHILGKTARTAYSSMKTSQKKAVVSSADV